MREVRPDVGGIPRALEKLLDDAQVNPGRPRLALAQVKLRLVKISLAFELRDFPELGPGFLGMLSPRVFLKIFWVANAVFVGLIQADMVILFVPMSRRLVSGTMAYWPVPLRLSASPL